MRLEIGMYLTAAGSRDAASVGRLMFAAGEMAVNIFLRPGYIRSEEHQRECTCCDTFGGGGGGTHGNRPGNAHHH